MKMIRGVIVVGALATAAFGFGCLALFTETSRWIIDNLSDG